MSNTYSSILKIGPRVTTKAWTSVGAWPAKPICTRSRMFLARPSPGLVRQTRGRVYLLGWYGGHVYDRNFLTGRFVLLFDDYVRGRCRGRRRHNAPPPGGLWSGAVRTRMARTSLGVKDEMADERF